MSDQEVDVLIVGAGPVGLLMTYQLARLGISTCLIDAADKASPNFPMYGRASTLFPRTSEMLDQLDLFDDMAQTGLISRRNVTWKDGKRVQGRGWFAFENIQGTFFDFMLNIRLKYSEDIFRKKVEELGSRVQAPVKLVDLSINEGATDDFQVTSTCATPDGRSFKIRSKYVVGSDGGGSMVRKLAQISFTGADKADHWVRIDAFVKTNMPDSRIGFGAIESKAHGQVLWVALDHGATRIGYVLTQEMYEKYGRKMTQEEAIHEAKAAVAPFELEFEHVDWHTVYGVKQFVADTFHSGRVLLAGDAAHAHSSATAQGMNTGVHDACSLAWRLAGVINGLYKAEVLSNYSEERRASAQHLIENDKTVAALISRHKPERYKDRPERPDELFAEFLKEEWGFTMGLEIHYPPNLLNDVDGSFPPVSRPPGYIAPDVILHKHGFARGAPTRLHQVTKYNGRFHILVFSGDVRSTSGLLQTLRTQVDEKAARFQHAITFVTIVYGAGDAFAEYLGVEQFGNAYWDCSHSAHESYGVSPSTGVIAILRPDGILGFIASLDGFERVIEYLGRSVIPREAEKVWHGANGVVGEMIAPDENNLYYKQPVSHEDAESHEQGTLKKRSNR